MKAVDASIALTAVGFVQPGVGLPDDDSFSQTLLKTLRDHEALELVDMLQIHAYTPEGAFPLTDEASASRKIASAALFTHVLQACRAQIASVRGAEHVGVWLDEWGWGRAGHTGAIFMAAALNAFHRFGPFVRIGAKAVVINVEGVIERTGDVVRRTPAYDVFRAFNEEHEPESVQVRVDGLGAHQLDVSALTDRRNGRTSVFVVNAAGVPTPVDLTVEGAAATTPVVLRAIAPGTEDLTGTSEVSEQRTTLSNIDKVAPFSLTVVRL